MATKTKKKTKGEYYTPPHLSETANPPFSLALREGKKPGVSFEMIYEAANGACAPLADAIELAKSKAQDYTGADKSTVDAIASNLSSALANLGGILGRIKIMGFLMEDV